MIIEIEDIIKRRFKYKIMNTRINNKQNHSIITSNWFTPLEAFTPKPKYAKPLQYGKIKNIDNLIINAYSNLDSNDVLLAHETSENNAEKIMKHGFKKQHEGSCDVRDNAVFGWIHKEDVGEHTELDNYVVLFSASKNNVYVSSYDTSAKKIILGDINEKEYAEKHLMTYSEYESIHENNPEFIRHLHYSQASLFPSK